MNDLIRRKDVYAIIDKKTVRGKLQVAREVQALPPVDYDISPYADKQKWIPCSKRLPEIGQRCLVCDNGQIGMDTFLGRGNQYNWGFYITDYEAWMPLPEPYREEGD